MSCSDQLLAQYQEWLKIVRNEQIIIQDRKWSDLNQFVEKKQAIIGIIQKVELENPEWKSGQSEDLRVLIHQVADLEQLNHSILKERSAELKGMIEDVVRQGQMVRQLQNRYQDSTTRIGRQISGEG